jgi:hypothetical protein
MAMARLAARAVRREIAGEDSDLAKLVEEKV